MDFNEVKGQEYCIRGLKVAAVGNHSVLLVGPRQSGKTMLAERFETITDIPEYSRRFKIIDFPVGRQMTLDRIEYFDGIIVGQMLPCPCGNFTHPSKECHCTPYQVQRHLAHTVPDSIKQKIDIYLHVPIINSQEVSEGRRAKPSEILKQEVMEAKGRNIIDVDELDKEAEELLKTAILDLGFTPTIYDRLLRVAQSIARLDKKDGLVEDKIEASHISEAISYCNLECNILL